MKNIDTNDQSLAFDAKALGDLKRAAASQQGTAVRETAKQFEVLFTNMLMKSMRDASPKDGFMSSGAGDMYTGMLDQQFAQKMAARGTGLADVIARQLGGAADAQSTGPQSGLKKSDGSAAVGSLGSTAASPSDGRSLSVKFADTAGLRKIGQAQTQIGVSDSSSRPAIRNARFEKSAMSVNQVAATTSDQVGGVVDKATAFFDRMTSHANEAANATGIPAKFMLGQAALESGWGKREIRNPDGSTSHNLFGIKAGANWSGPTVSVTTTEYVNGVARQQVEKFRAYSSYAESFKDYASLITKSPRYSAVVGNSSSVEGFATSLQRAGYATDPRYAEKLSRTINHVISIAKSRPAAPSAGWNQA